MADTVRIKSTAPMAFVISEPHPDPKMPGSSPVLKSAVISPGVNENIASDLWNAWCAAVPNHSVLESGCVHVMTDDEPDQENGFEPALERLKGSDLYKGAEDGSTHTDAGPVPAEHFRNVATGPSPLPAGVAGNEPNLQAGVTSVVSATPLKVPATSDMSQEAQNQDDDAKDEHKTGFAAVAPDLPGH